MPAPTKYLNAKGETRWQVRYRKPNGDPTRKTGFERRKDAEDWWTGQAGAIRKGAFVSQRAGQTKVSTLLRNYADSLHHLSPSTRERYTGIANGILTQEFGGVPLNKMSRPVVRAWIAAQVDAERPAETIHKQAGVVRRALALGVEDGLLASNPADGRKLPPITPTEMRFLDLDQLTKLAAAAGTDSAAIWVLGICGLRMGELVGLRHGDIDRRAGVIHIARSVTLVNNRHVEGPPKNKKRRTVPLPPTVADMIPAALNPDQLVFPAPEGGFIRHGNWRTRIFDPAVTAAKVSPITVEKVVKGKKMKVVEYELHPHELRHTAASLMIAQGANIKAVSSALGHARASITLDRYGHLYPSDLDALTGSLDTVLTMASKLSA